LAIFFEASTHSILPPARVEEMLRPIKSTVKKSDFIFIIRAGWVGIRDEI